MKRTLFLILLLAVPLGTPVAAQDDAFPRYTFLGQVRHRFEVNARDFNDDTDPIAFNLLRTRLGVRFLPIENVEALLQVQDSRLFGEEVNTLTDGDETTVNAISG